MKLRIIRTSLLLLSLLFLLFLLSGCWNYRSLSDILIVAGMSIDKEPIGGQYVLNFEVIDLLKPVKQEGIKTRLVEAKGITLFDAIRNGKEQTSKKLYFGHMEIVILSEQTARNEKIGEILDFFLRENECRETMYIAVSKANTAKEILQTAPVDNSIISFGISKIIEDDSRYVSTTVSSKLYNDFNDIKSPGTSLSLPAVKITSKSSERIAEVDGIAVFDGDSMLGFLTAEESKYVLFASDEIKGGIISLYSPLKEGENASFEIIKNKTKTSFSKENGNIVLALKTNTTVFMDEYGGSFDGQNKSANDALKQALERWLEENISTEIEKVRDVYRSDIFGFGRSIYRHNRKLWQEVKNDWPQEFKKMKINVDCSVKIINTASLKKT